jgi:hypothetical protein
VTEGDVIPENNSPALTRIGDLGVAAFTRSGHLFRSEVGGVRKELPELLNKHKLEHVQLRACALEYCSGTEQWQDLFDDVRRGMRTALPFLRKWIHISDDYEALYQQALAEMQQADFVATWYADTVWGSVSIDGE